MTRERSPCQVFVVHPEWKERLRAVAREDGRSMNSLAWQFIKWGIRRLEAEQAEERKRETEQPY